MVMSTQGGGSGSSSGAGACTEPIDEQMQEFASSNITRGILEQTIVIFGMVKVEILDERLGVFRAKFMAIVGS